MAKVFHPFPRPGVCAGVVQPGTRRGMPGVQWLLPYPLGEPRTMLGMRWHRTIPAMVEKMMRHNHIMKPMKSPAPFMFFIWCLLVVASGVWAYLFGG